jgi:hypothetical protein
MNIRTITLTAVIILAAMVRFIPGLPPNLKPISAIVIFGAIRYSNRSAGLALPILLVLATDIVKQLLYHSGPGFSPGFYLGMEWVYAGYIIIAVMAAVFRGTRSPATIALVTFAGACIFFALSNFGYWLEGDVEHLYPRTLGGLWECYMVALPFFRTSLYGDAIFVVVLFGGWYLAELYVPALRPAPANA